MQSPSARRRRPSAALLIAALALFLSLGTTAWAAVKLTGAQIKDGSLTSVDFANGSKGLSGANVQDGSLQLADLSAAARGALVEPLPGTPLASGETLTGELDWDGDGLDQKVSKFAVTVSASRPLTGLGADNAQINFSADGFDQSSDDDAACTGTVEAPTAPPGKVCLYLINAASDVSSLRGMSLPELGTTTGFTVNWDDAGQQSHDSFVFATWAYTAP